MFKTCTKCKIEKPVSEFSKRYDYPNKTLSACNSCERIRKRNDARRYHSDPDTRRKVSLRQKLWTYGLTQDQYDKLVTDAGGRCQLCGDTAPLRIDHDHATGEVRGLLCHHCNVALGHFKDSPERLEKAIEYLWNHTIQYLSNTNRAQAADQKII